MDKRNVHFLGKSQDCLWVHELGQPLPPAAAHGGGCRIGASSGARPQSHQGTPWKF
jgi:hypothetical protein